MTTVDLDPDDVGQLALFRRALRGASVDLQRDLPWTRHNNPWAILVSEVMLQQTSTARVIGPWTRFMAEFPTVNACAQSTLAQVLRHWSGLGYPRRAKSLHDAALAIVERFDSRVPTTIEGLLSLPGVGPYTARAVASFAYQRRVAVLDTNVGRVLARAIANRPLRVGEAQDLATALLPRSDVADFNQAMIDLGAQWCVRNPRCAYCPLRAQCRWIKEGGEDPAPLSAAVSRPQRPFDGSDRQVRGRVMRALEPGPVTRRRLGRELADVDEQRLDRLVQQLAHEGLVHHRGTLVALVGDEDSPR